MKMSCTNIKYADFAEFFKELQKEKIPVGSKYKKGDNCHYCYIPTGRDKTHFEWFFDKEKKRLKIGFHSENDCKEKNKRIFDVTRHFKDIIEKKTGKEVMCEKEYEKKGSWYGIYIEKKYCELDEDLKKWAADKMVVFYDTIINELEKTSKMLTEILDMCGNKQS